MIKIRHFKESDDLEIKRIFNHGTRGLIQVCINDHLFWWPSYIAHLLYFTILCFVLQISLIYILVVYSVLLAFLIWYSFRSFDNYIKYSLNDDLLDIKKYYNGTDATMWVAEDESKKIVGCIALDAHAWKRAQETNTNNSIDYDQYEQRITELRRCSVDQSCRNRGIGKLLVNHLLKEAKDKYEAKHVFLTTTSTQRPAIELYKKTGFKITGVVDEFMLNIRVFKMEINF